MKQQNGFFLLIISVFCSILIFAQDKNNRPNEGSCKAIIQSLRELHRNDSTAIEIFKNDYRIFNMLNVVQDSLLKKNYSEVIHYFNSEESKDCFCRARMIVLTPEEINHRNVLLDISHQEHFNK